MNEHLIYMTVPNEDEAASLAKTLLTEQLIACANIIPGIRSLYRWEGEVHDEPEVVVIAKTTASLVEPLIERVNALHSYECPCVVSAEIAQGNPDFLKWIQAECRTQN